MIIFACSLSLERGWLNFVNRNEYLLASIFTARTDLDCLEWWIFFKQSAPFPNYYFGVKIPRKSWSWGSHGRKQPGLKWSSTPLLTPGKMFSNTLFASYVHWVLFWLSPLFSWTCIRHHYYTVAPAAFSTISFLEALSIPGSWITSHQRKAYRYLLHCFWLLFCHPTMIILRLLKRKQNYGCRILSSGPLYRYWWAFCAVQYSSS